MIACTICGKSGEHHHLYTQKSRPDLKDEDWNKIPLCREHHTEMHMSGTCKMARKHLSVEIWLLQHRWELRNVAKWYHKGSEVRIGEVRQKDQDLESEYESD